MIEVATRSTTAHVELRCEPCEETHPHSMAQMADGAIAFVCWACGTETVLREEPVGESVSA